MLARLDGRTREHDALDLAPMQRLDGRRHREVALAGSRGTDAEGDDRAVDGVGVALLSRGRGTDGLALGAAHHLVLQHLARSKVVGDHVDGARDLRGVEGLAALEDEDELVEEPQHLRRVGSRDRDLVALDADLGAWERPFDHAQVLVARTEQARHQVRVGNQGGRRQGLSGRGIRCHPGGHSNRLPPRT